MKNKCYTWQASKREFDREIEYRKNTHVIVSRLSLSLPPPFFSFSMHFLHAFRCRRTTLIRATLLCQASLRISRRHQMKNVNMPWNFWLIRTNEAAISFWNQLRSRWQPGRVLKMRWWRLCSWRRRWTRCVHDAIARVIDFVEKCGNK